MNNLVKYNNEMNKVRFTGFSKIHMDLFMAICSKMKAHGEEIITLDTNELKQIIRFERGGNRDFFEELHMMVAKLQLINGSIVDRTQKGKRKFISFNLFPLFAYDEESGLLEVQVNSTFSWLLNEFESYTVFEMNEFLELNSKYAKSLYRMLKQWRTQGQYTFYDLEEFKELLDVPKSYTNRQLMQYCVNTAVAEISKLDKSFKNFKCEPIYARKRGKPLEALKFTWAPEGGKKAPKKALEEASEEPSAADEQLDELDALIDLIDNCNLGIGAKSTISIARKATALGRNFDYVKDVLEIIQKQDCDNVAAKAMSLIENGYDVPKKKKKTVEHNFKQRNYDAAELDKLFQ